MPDPKPETAPHPTRNRPTVDEGADGRKSDDTPEQKIPGKPISDMDPPGQEGPEDFD